MTSTPHQPLVGRERERAQLLSLISAGARCVLVSGLGGIGKSAVVGAVADALVSTGRAVAIIDAAWMHRAADLVEALARELGAGPVDAGADVRQLAARLRQSGDRGSVVVLDNADALAPYLEATLKPLLDAVPSLTLVITTRIAWAWNFAHVEPLEPLAHGDAESDAVELLRGTATAVTDDATWRNDAASIVQIAQRFGGLPLGLVLVGRRASLGTPAELLRLLDDGWSPTAHGSDTRQGSIEAVVAWSCARLEAPAAACLNALAFAAPGTPRWLLAAILGTTEAGVLSAMESLVDHGLLQGSGIGSHADGLPNHVRDVLRMRCTPMTRNQLAVRLIETLSEEIGPIRGLDPIAPTIVTRLSPAAPAALEAIEALVETATTTTLAASLRVATALLIVRRTRAVGSGPVIETLARLLARARSLQEESLSEPIVTASLRLLMTVASIERAGPRVPSLIALLEGDAINASRTRVLDARIATGIALTYRGDFETALRFLDLPDALEAGSIRALQLCHDFRAHALRLLGRLSPDVAESAWQEVRARCLGSGAVVEALCLDAAHAVTSFQLNIPNDVGVGLAERVIAIATGTGHRAAAGYVRVKLAEHLADTGNVNAALASIDEVLDSHADLTASFEWVEAKLDRALLCLVAGLHDRAAEDLAHVEAFIATPVEVALHRAMVTALRALEGDAYMRTTLAPPPHTVEDVTASLLIAVASPHASRPSPAAIRDACASSARARRAAALLSRIDQVRAGDADVVLFDRFAGVVKRGASIVKLGAMPLCHRFIAVLADARRTGEPWLADREELARTLWPDERMSTRARDQRIYALVSALRRAGGAELVRVDRGRFALAPDCKILEARLGGDAGLGQVPAPPRGRGRPPRRNNAAAGQGVNP